MKKFSYISLFILGWITIHLLNPNIAVSQTKDLVYKIDFSEPDIPEIQENTTFEMGWAAPALQRWVDPHQIGDKSYPMEGNLLLFNKKDGKKLKIPNNLMVKCVIHTNKDWGQFSSPVKDGAFQGKVFLSDVRTEATFKFDVFQIDPNTGLTIGNRLAHFEIHLR